MEIIGADLVEVFLITESAGMHKAALVPILAMLQCLVIPVLLATHRANIPELKKIWSQHKQKGSALAEGSGKLSRSLNF